MLFLLKEQVNELEHAKREHAASSALDKHRSLQAKARFRRLLSSKRGLATAFLAGVAKGTTSSTSPKKAQSNFSSLIARQLIAAWLGTTTVTGGDSTSSDVSE